MGSPLSMTVRIFFIVSTLPSSVPFSSWFLKSCCEGWSAVLSWCTRLYEFSRNVAMLGLWCCDGWECGGCTWAVLLVGTRMDYWGLPSPTRPLVVSAEFSDYGQSHIKRTTGENLEVMATEEVDVLAWIIVNCRSSIEHQLFRGRSLSRSKFRVLAFGIPPFSPMKHPPLANSDAPTGLSIPTYTLASEHGSGNERTFLSPILVSHPQIQRRRHIHGPRSMRQAIRAILTNIQLRPLRPLRP